MKLDKWTLGLAAAGVVSLGSVASAEEKAMSQVLTAVSGTQIGGYVDTSIIWKPGNGNANLPGRAFDGVGKLDGFNLNVAALTIQKVPGQDNWAAGYRMDLLFGPDAVGYNVAVGNNGVQNNNSDFGIKQAYVDLVVPAGAGLDFKVGTFNTVVGYESFESYLNPNYSRSFGWQLEPTQHTGLLMSYPIAEGFSISAGIANTYMAGINARNTMRIETTPTSTNYTTIDSAKAYMASLGLTAPESWGFLAGSSLNAGFVNGFGGDPGHNSSLFYVGSTVKTGVEGLAFGGAFDYRKNGANYITTTSNENWAWAMAGYLTYAATEHLKFAARVDYTAGTDGTFFDNAVSDTVGNPVYGTIDHQNKLLAMTGTVEYNLWANALTRLELRWDHSTNGKAYGGSVAGLPDQENAVTLALNLVYKF
jgi:hypothetical protein